MNDHNTIFLIIGRIEKLFYLFIALYSFNLNVYAKELICDNDCFKSVTEKISSINTQKSLIVLYQGKNQNIFSEFDTSNNFRTFIFKDLIENLSIFQIEEEENNKLNIYENLERVLRKNGFQVNYNNKITLDRILSNSLNITQTPFNLNIDKKILFEELKSKSLISSNDERPEFNHSSSMIILKKYIIYNILNKNLINNITKNESKYNIPINENIFFYNITDNTITSILENFQSDSLMNDILYNKLSDKNFSISEHFPATGYGFSEYKFNNMEGFISIYNDSLTSELLYVIPDYQIILYLNTKRNSSLNLLKYINLFINHIYQNSEITLSENISDFTEFSGEYLSTSSPKKGLFYLYNTINCIKIESFSKGLSVKGLDSSDIFFENLRNLEFINRDIPSVRIQFTTDNFGKISGFDLSMGNLQSYEKINLNQNIDIFQSLTFIIYYFIFIILINILEKSKLIFHPKNNSKKLIYFKNLILSGSIIISLYIVLIFTFLNYINIDTDNFQLISFYRSLIPILSTLFFSYFTYVFIELVLTKELNYFRIIKYSIYIGMVIYFYYTIIYHEIILITL